MSVIYNDGNVNLGSLNSPDIYIRIVRPPGFIRGVQTDVAAVIGTAAWGPMNQPVLLGSPQDIQRVFGGVVKGTETDKFDLCRDGVIAFQQAQSEASLELVGLRVGDGTEAKASVDLDDTTSGTALVGATATAIYNGVRGNDLKLIIEAGSKTTHYHVTVVPFNGALYERFRDIKGGSAGLFWSNLALAVNNGQDGIRGPSQLISIGSVNASAIDPALGTFSLSGGADGRSGVTKTHLLGSDTAEPRTGMYALRGVSPVPTIMWIAGLTDSTAYPSIHAFVNQEGLIALLPFPTGTTTATAITNKKSIGIDDPNVAYCKDSIRYFDTTSGQQLLMLPTPFIAGRIASMSPENSPTNKPVYAVIGTERNSPQDGNQPYSNSEVGQLHDNGIMFVTNPVPGGNYWGIRHGQNSSSDNVRAVVEYARMTNYLAHSLAAAMGKFVGQLQSRRKDDPVRAAVKLEMDQFLSRLQSLGQIDEFLTICDLSNNSFDSIGAHFLFADAKVVYLSSIQFFVINLEGGTTTVIAQSAPREGVLF